MTKLADAYKVSGDTFYTQNEKSVLPLGTLTVEETKAPDGYLLDGAYMQAGDSTEQIKGMYLTQITEDGELAVLSGSNQYSVSDQVIRGGVKIQKRDLGDKRYQGTGKCHIKRCGICNYFSERESGSGRRKTVQKMRQLRRFRQELTNNNIGRFTSVW